jgi:iron complex outermembrane receptor protein
MDLPVPMDAISQVEVLRGSGSTLYGSDAVGGVINLITRIPESSEFRLGAAAGNFGVNQQSFSLSAVRRRFSEQLSGSRDFSSGFRPGREYRNLTLASATEVSSVLGSTSLILAHNDRPFGADNFYGAYPSWEHTRTWFASVRQQWKGRTETAFAWRRHTDLFVLDRNRPEWSVNQHAADSFQAAVRRWEQLGKNVRLYYGGEGLRDSIVSTNLGSHSRATGAAYAAIDFRALGRASFSAGVREQVYSGAHSVLSPTLAGGFWIDEKLRLKGSVSRAFRLPSYTELYYHDPATVGSPLLLPEKAWSYEAGLDWSPSRRLRGEAVVFHRRESDGIDFVRRSESDIWQAANIQRLHFTGVEASVTLRLAPSHQVSLSYTALYGASQSLAGLLSRYVFNYPRHSAVATWQGALPAGLVGRVKVGATQRLGRDSYALADLYLARAAGRLRPFVQATNVANVSYQETLGVPMPGRGFLGGVELVLSRRSN